MKDHEKKYMMDIKMDLDKDEMTEVMLDLTKE